LATSAAFDEHQRVSPARPWFNPLAAIVLWGGAVWFDWLAIVTWPIVFAALRRTPRRPARGAWTVAALAVGLVALAAHFQGVATAARAQSFTSHDTLTLWSALQVAFDSRLRMPPGSYVAADVTTSVSTLALGLVVVALIFADLERWWRRAVLLSGLLVVAVIGTWPVWQDEVLRFVAWSVTPLGAVGLTWVSRQSASVRVGSVATLAIGTVLVGEAVVMGARPLANQEARGFRDALERALAAAVTGPTVIMAEDTRVDSALAAWAAGRWGTTRAVQDGRVVATAFDEGQTVLAGPTGRRHLELTGIAFAHRFTIIEPAPFVMSAAVTALRCASVRSDRWSQLPGLEYTGRLGIDLPPGVGGEMQLIVGDSLPLQVWAESADGREAPIILESLSSGPGVAAPPPDYWFDGGLPGDGPQVIERIHVPMHPARASLVALHLGRRAPRVIARLVGVDDAARGRVCAAPIGREPVFADGRRTERVSLAEGRIFGTGWYGLERRGALSFKWADTDAVLLLPSAERMDVEVMLDADADPPNSDGAGTSDRAADGTQTPQMRGAAEGADTNSTAADSTAGADAITLTLRVNGIDVGMRRIRRGARRYAWAVPAGVWLAGTNELWWHTSRALRPVDAGGADRRRLALRVEGIELAR
jgi:hypothetical protein